MKRKVHIIVEGHVQGVGFRHFTKTKADELDITGWAKNLDNGAVEIKAQGQESPIEEFVTFVKNGASPSSRVDVCHINELHTDDQAEKRFKTL
ncbi:acylphosphatase [Bacillus sp. P14.5]|uniref:acylphosphatase n=1 Tax=Bacillus sp. P14.5 TaxID=1983400 RepID=UPI000DE9BBA3|nr:acylphosphatase [Bacillus sp. P14.5]